MVGSVLIAYALIGYPATASLAGQWYPAVPTFGLPCPTPLVTLGLLVWCLRPVPWTVRAVPVGSLIAMVVAVPFGIVEDFVLSTADVGRIGRELKGTS